MKEIRPNTINWKQKCWRYLKIDRFIESIENGYMYFAAANEFEDIFEGSTSIINPLKDSIPNDSIFIMFNDAFKQLQRLTKINCWHKADYESYAMWKIYAHDKKGVAITTTPEKMKQAFKPYRIEPQYCEEDLYIGNVEYTDLASQRIQDTMLKMFYYKHMVYADENEIRLSISLRTAEELGVSIPEKGIFVEVDYFNLIDSIIVGPNVDIETRERIQQVAEKIGVESKIINSCLTYNPRFI